MQPTECRHGRARLPSPVVDLRRPAPARPSLQACPDHFRPLFARRDQATTFAAYAEGLLSGERRTDSMQTGCSAGLPSSRLPVRAGPQDLRGRGLQAPGTRSGGPN